MAQRGFNLTSPASLAFAAAVAVVAILLLWPVRSPATLDTSTMTVQSEHSEALPGGATTVPDSGRNAFGRSPMNMKPDRWPLFVGGKEVFDRDWLRTAGERSPVGPLYSAVSCKGCHVKDGRGRPPLAPGEEPRSMVMRLARFDHDGNSIASPYGDQLDYHAIDGYAAEGTVTITRREIEGEFVDGTEYRLERPAYHLEMVSRRPIDASYRYSPRVAPANYGLGLLEAVPERDIAARADPDDRNRDGISGRVNYVLDRSSGRRRAGRFGWKAGQPSIEQQVAAAFFNDMAITSRLFNGTSTTSVPPATASNHELSDEDFHRLVYYVTLIAVPARRSPAGDTVRHGQAIFNAIGCAACHTPAMTTGVLAGYPEVSSQRIHAYTDLLLHDMGDDLADAFPEGEAGGSEWRTPPLWGIGLVEVVNAHTRFLHDGRAGSLEEAVLWHGGEGLPSRERYRSLNQSDRRAVIAFLRSL